MGSYKSLSDEELAAKINQRDIAALEEIYLRYFAGLYDHARKMLQDNEGAEDLVHDLFAQLIDNSENININTSLQSYLYQSVRNRVINAFQKSKNRQKYIDGIKDLYLKGTYATDELVQEREMKRRIEEAVAAFPPKTREAYQLSRVKHLTRKEIAQKMGTAESTVNIQIHKALRILRAKLTCWFF